MNIKTFFILILTFALFISCKQSNEELINKGVKLHNKGKYKEAIALYTKALSKNNKLQLAYYNRGLCYIETEDYFKSLNDFNTILKLKTPGEGNFIFELNPNSPVADEEARTQIPYDDALYQRAQVKWHLDSLLSSYQDFQRLVDRGYKEKVLCILWQADIWHDSEKEETACEYAQRARKLAVRKDEVDESEKSVKLYCEKNNNR
jgi:tetratricopeptide (TPR) repeat protein